METYLTSLVIVAFFGFLIWRVIKSEKNKPQTPHVTKNTDGSDGIPQDVDRLS